MGLRGVKSDIRPLFVSRQGVDHRFDFCFDYYRVIIDRNSLYVSGIRLHNRVHIAVPFQVDKFMHTTDFTNSVPSNGYTVVFNDLLA